MPGKAKKIIVVTGVSRGLGRAMVSGFVSAGHTVIGTARNADAIEALSTEYASPHRFDVVDNSSPAQINSWADSVLEEFGAPDLLINNAGVINQNAPLWEVPEAEFSLILDVNVKGVYGVCKCFLPAMIKRGRGVIANISSGWGRSVSADVAPYCASKFAVEGMTLALAQELPSGVAAIPLNPGVINTDMLRSCWGDSASDFYDANEWAGSAVPFLLGLDASDNGKQLTVP